jgi:hypothetical protein
LKGVSFSCIVVEVEVDEAAEPSSRLVLSTGFSLFPPQKEINIKSINIFFKKYFLPHLQAICPNLFY